MKKIILLLPVMLLVSACSSLVHLDENEKLKSWNNHLIKINKVKSWRISGRAFVKNRNESATFKLQWEQNNSNYELRLISAFGQGTFLINGSEKGVNIQTPKNKIFSGSSANQLIREKLGWNINLTGLKYWVRGVPKPNVEYSELLLSNHGRLSNMKQSNFTIKVSRYYKKNDLFLPEKIFIKGKDIQLKLIINEWEIY